MGYKSVLRAINSASKKATKESERQEKRLIREQERLEKKATKIDEKMEKIVDSLNDLYAKGKVDKKEYNKLLNRKNDIKIDLIIFGKTSGVSLAKRYISGKIDKTEFENVAKELVPQGLFEERQSILDGYNEQKKVIEDFINSCNKELDICQKCSKKKGLFNPLKKVEDLQLCGKCKLELEKLQDYAGFEGDFYEVDPCKISLEDLNKNNPLVVGVKADFVI